MSDYLGVVTLIGQAKLAASVGGSPLDITDIAVGDGGGAPITPVAGMTALVGEVWRSSMITGGVDPSNAAIWRFTTTLPEEAGPFVVREIGLIDADGDLIAIARHPVVDKKTPTDGVGVSIETDIIVPISALANVNVVVNTNTFVDIARLLRAPFLAVDSIADEPPADPQPGQLHLVGDVPLGAFEDHPGELAQWQGAIWVFADAPERTLIGVAGGDYLERTASGWRSAALGPRHAVAGGTADALTVTLDPPPASLWTGLSVLVTVLEDNTGPATINVNGLGAVAIERVTGDPLIAGDLPAGALALLGYDGAVFQILSALPSAAPPAASQSVAGILRLATDAELLAGALADVGISPAVLMTLLASATVKGLVQLATEAEVLAGAEAGKAVVPATLAALIATTTRRGLSELATSAEVKALTDASRAVTPSGLGALFERNLIANPGYITLGPVIINFGLTELPVPTNASSYVWAPVTFAKEFPTACKGLLVSLRRDPLATLDGHEFGPFYYGPTTAGAYVGCSKATGAGVPVGGYAQRSVFWIAFGY